LFGAAVGEPNGSSSSGLYLSLHGLPDSFQGGGSVEHNRGVFKLELDPVLGRLDTERGVNEVEIHEIQSKPFQRYFQELGHTVRMTALDRELSTKYGRT